MKRIILFVALMVTITAAVGQEGKTPAGDNTPAASGQIPHVVIDRFNREYPGISGNWSTDGENFKVQFIDQESRLGHIIVYDRNGDVIRRESELDGPKNPGAINEYYQKNFPGESLKTWSVEDKSGEISYYTKHNDQVLRFNKDGMPAAAATPPNAPVKAGKTAK